MSVLRLLLSKSGNARTAGSVLSPSQSHPYSAVRSLVVVAASGQDDDHVFVLRPAPGSTATGSTRTPVTTAAATWNPSCRALVQVRWKRRDGHKAFTRVRPPTKKQRKKYHRKLKQLQAAQDKHSRPGSKAGPRREWMQSMKEQMLLEGEDGESPLLEDDYNVGDALLDDLIGNSKDLTAQPTPEPKYLGHLHETYHEQLLNSLQKKQILLDSGQSAGEMADNTTSLVLSNGPSDRIISLALRSYRDKFGTRQRPVGLVAALKYLLQDVGIDVGSFGELTYTTLLTCCRTPTEARRILQMMQQEQHPVSSYSWSILVDIYAKVGDYEGCANAMEEMIAEGVPPTLPAYTSFLAACYKVVKDGRVAHSVRAKAAKASWDKWQEMRIVGLDPDVMAYGAMLRLCAAQGHPERAINLLEEMQQLEVKPTTLCFSSALRAVAKSQETAIRYERGSSKRNKLREFITAHHGNMARTIVIQAESAEVEQDDGFVSALIMCAAASGDAATAKAIYVASQIRRMDQFRTIGPDDHLARLRGEAASVHRLQSEQQLLASSGTANNGELAVTGGLVPAETEEFSRREYGKDSRVLSAILHACARAVDKNGVGTMWQGRENRGYLCDNSLRLLKARRIPQYSDNSIPGQGRTDDLTWDGEHKDEDYRGNKRRSRKFTGVDVSEDGASTIDELDEQFARLYEDEEGRRLKEFRKTTGEDIWRMKYGEEEEEGWVPKLPDDQSAGPALMQGSIEQDATSVATVVDGGDEEELFFDYDIMRWNTRSKRKDDEPTSVEESEDVSDVSPEVFDETETEEDELYFDDEIMKWKTRPRAPSASPTRYESKVLEDKSQSEPTKIHSDPVNEKEFALFLAELQSELEMSGESVDSVDKDEALELFHLMRNEYEEVMNMDENQLNTLTAELDAEDESLDLTGGLDHEDAHVESEATDAESSPDLPLARAVPENARKLQTTSNVTKAVDYATYGNQTSATVTLEDVLGAAGMDSQFEAGDPQETRTVAPATTTAMEQVPFAGPKVSIDDLEEATDDELSGLRQQLPALSVKRLRQVQRVFHQSLGDPSLLDLVPLVRERMPDYITATWLKQMSSLTARYVVDKASQDGLVDLHMFNGVLELEASCGSLDRAADFYESEFTRHGLKPNEYSNRLLIQMFLGNNRLSRALEFNRNLKEDKGEHLDIPSYGSLIDYCGRRDQLGSAMLLLQECLAVHDAPPGDAYLAHLRRLCRKEGLSNGLDALVGRDPVEWLRHGEAHLKREMSKKGRRNVQLARNRLLQI